jgi:hypothetical protein
MGGFEMDVADALPVGTKAVQLMKLQGGHTIEFSRGGSFKYMPNNRTKAVKEFWVQAKGSDPRLNNKGRFSLVIERPPISQDGLTGGVAQIEIQARYRVRFYNRTLEPNVANAMAGASFDATQSAGAAKTDPMGFAANAGISSVDVRAHSADGLIVSGDGTNSLVFFPVGSCYDSVSRVALMTSCGSATGSVTAVVQASNLNNVYAQATPTDGSAGFAQYAGDLLDNAGSYTLAANSFKYVAASNSWVSVGGQLIRCWGYYTIHWTGTVTCGAANIIITCVLPYNLSASDYMLLHAGPACAENRHVRSYRGGRQSLTEWVDSEMKREAKERDNASKLEVKLLTLEAENDILRRREFLRKDEAWGLEKKEDDSDDEFYRIRKQRFNRPTPLKIDDDNKSVASVTKEETKSNKAKSASLK